MTTETKPVALVTGASRGLGRALATRLHERGWQLVLDARNPLDLAAAFPDAVVVAGDITDPLHRSRLAAAVDAVGRLDLLVNNASELGPSPLPTLAEHSVAALHQVFDTNTIAPIALIQLVLHRLVASSGSVINVSSDAAAEAYETWGGYGASKAALDHVSAVLAVEEPSLAVYAVDPGDMRTAMHQAAFPGQDISDRPSPDEVVPALLRLLDERSASGRYRAAELRSEPAGATA